MRNYTLHRMAIVVALVATAVIATGADAAAAGGGRGGMGGGHFGGAVGGGRVGGFAGGHLGGGRFAGRFEHGHRARGVAVPFGYYDDWYGGYYDPSTVTPDEQPTSPTAVYPPTYPTAAYPYVKPPRSSCSTQTYKVPSEAGGDASVNVVRC